MAACASVKIVTRSSVVIARFAYGSEQNGRCRLRTDRDCRRQSELAGKGAPAGRREIGSALDTRFETRSVVIEWNAFKRGTSHVLATLTKVSVLRIVTTTQYKRNGSQTKNMQKNDSLRYSP